MGGSRIYGTRKLRTGGKISGSPGSSNAVLDSVVSGVQNEIISQSLGAVISYIPTLNTLVYGLKLVKIAYEMYCKGKEAYDKSGGNKEEAIKAAAGVVIEKAKDKLKSEVIRLAISSAVNEQNINMDNTTKTIVIDGISGVIENSL